MTCSELPQLTEDRLILYIEVLNQQQRKTAPLILKAETGS